MSVSPAIAPPSKARVELQGLTSADATARLHAWGLNATAVEPRKPLWREIGSRYIGVVPFLGLVIIILSLTLADENGRRGYFSVGVLFVLINANVILDYVANRRVRDVAGELQRLCAHNVRTKRDDVVRTMKDVDVQ